MRCVCAIGLTGYSTKVIGTRLFESDPIKGVIGPLSDCIYCDFDWISVVLMTPALAHLGP